MCFVFVHRLTQTVTVDVTETVHSHPYDSTTGLMNQEFLCSLDALRGRGLGRGTRGATHSFPKGGTECPMGIRGANRWNAATGDTRSRRVEVWHAPRSVGGH